MDWLREGLAVGGFASNLAFGIWLSAAIGASIFGFGALITSLRRGHRRFVRTLNYATITCAADLMGLIAMLLKDNPGRWERTPWLVSFMPFVLAFFGVIIAACRGDAAPARQAAKPIKPQAQPDRRERGLGGPKQREAALDSTPVSDSADFAASAPQVEPDDRLFAGVSWSTEPGSSGFLDIESPLGGKDI